MNDFSKHPSTSAGWRREKNGNNDQQQQQNVAVEGLYNRRCGTNRPEWNGKRRRECLVRVWHVGRGGRNCWIRQEL